MDGLINEYFAAEGPQQEAIAVKLASTLGAGGIFALVKALQSQLTGPDEQVRADATLCLAQTLASTQISQDQRQVLWTFFCDRLSDGASFTPAINGLAAIRYLGDLAELKVAIESASFRRQPQAARYEGFKYIAQLLDQQKSPASLDLFLEMASGEKDPQNLILTLGMANTLLKTMELDTQQKEDLFDTTFCYFPVTFKPPKDMHYQVDVEEIKASLRNCLSAPAIAEHVIPGMISKLNAVNPAIKADVLLTLNQIVRSYPEEVLNAYWLPIWDSLKFEILHGSPENSSNAAVFEILQRLTVIPAFVDAVCEDIAKIDPTKKAMATQVCVLITGLANSQKLFSTLAKPALDVIFKEQQQSNIELINFLLATSYNLPDHQDDVLSLYLTGLSSQDYYSVTIVGLAPLAAHSPEFAPVIVQAVNQHLPDQKAIQAMANIARINSDAVQSECISGLFAKLDEHFDQDAKMALKVLAQIIVTKDLLHAVTIRLCSRAHEVTSMNYLFEILSTLHHALRALDIKDLSRYYKYIFPMLSLFFNRSPKPAALHDIVIDRMALIMETTVRALPESQQAAYAEETCRLIWPEDICVFGQTPSALSFLMTSCLVGIDEKNLPARFQISFVAYSDILKRTNQVFQRAGYLRYLSVGVNKWPQRFGDINLALKLLRTSLETNQDAVSSLEILSWLCKGLLMRNDSLGYEVAQYITDLLSNRQLGVYAARVFGVLISDDRILCKDNKIIVRNLYKQRLFLQLLPKLMSGFNSTDSFIRLNSMTALSALLRYTPAKVLEGHLEEIMPALLECLDPKLSPVLQSGALETIGSALEQDQGANKLFEPSLEKIIKSSLALATGSTEPACRSKAIEVLYLVTIKMTKISVRPFAPLVLRQLPTALSDIRRDVRKQASKCIQAYHVL